MTKIKCMIVDDEPLAINVIKKHLLHFDQLELVATCENAIEAFNTLSEQTIELIFLDINMPKLSGMELLKNLESTPMVIITTAYREYAVESFELDVLDYLVKPIAFPRFMKAIHKALRLHQNWTSEGTLIAEQGSTKAPDFIFLKVNKKMVKVFFEDILFIESLKDYVRVKTIYEDLITHYNLSGITELLPISQFLRIHRSYTIALNKVKAIDGNSIEIADKSLPIGRNYVKEVKGKILRQE